MATLNRTGTITFTNGSTALTGVGTTFTAMLFGDTILAPDGKWYEFATIASDTGATLSLPYTGTTVANAVGGTSWTMFRTALARDSVRTATRQLSEITEIYRDIINLTSDDQIARLDKLATADRAGLLLQKAGIDQFQAGIFEEDDFAIKFSLAAAWTKALGVNKDTGAVSIYSQLLFGNIVTPSFTIVATANDYAPLGHAQASVMRLTTDAARSMTGIVGGANGRVLCIINVGTFNLTLSNANALSIAANRFDLDADFVLPGKSSVMLMYDGVSSRWRHLAGIRGLPGTNGTNGTNGTQGIQGIQGTIGNTGATGAGYGGTSTSSLLISIASKVFVTQAGLAYVVGSRVRATSGVNWMEGLVTAYSTTNLTVNVTKISGSGTLATWTLSVAGEPGAGDLSSANNLSELTATAATARTNLGLGTAATQATGTSGAALPFLNGVNAWSGAQAFNGSNTYDRTHVPNEGTITTSVAADFSTKQRWKATVNGAAFVIANPTSPVTKALYDIAIDFTTTHSISFGSNFKIGDYVPTAVAGKKDRLAFEYDSVTTMFYLRGYRKDVGV